MEKIARNLGGDAAAKLRKDMESLERPRPDDIDTAQHVFVGIIRELDEKGEIALESS